MPDKQKQIVVIIGRPNTGKSTLFNSIINEKKAIVSKKSGTTRDAISASVAWNNAEFDLIDTAGLLPKTKAGLEENVQKQAEEALEKADLILFTVDIRTGPTPQEMNLAREFRKSKKPVILVINKAEGKKWRGEANTFNKFGLPSVIISSIQGVGVGDLLDKISSELPSSKKKRERKNALIKVGIFGKPNAGKSSLLNSLIGKEKVVVSEIPGTTRDAVDIQLSYGDTDIKFIDTAGIKRRTKVKENIERSSIERSLRMIKDIDIALFVIDADTEITKQDLRIADLLARKNKGVIIVANKWDLVKNKHKKKSEKELMDQFITYYQHHLHFLSWAPLIFISAKSGENVENIIDLVKNVYNERSKVIPQEELKDFIRAAYKKYPPPRFKKKNPPEIQKFIQVTANPPRFKVMIKQADVIKRYYLKYLEKELRKKFGFEGTPILILIGSKK